MIHLTLQERRVFIFAAFVFVLGVGLRMFQKTMGCNFCLIELYSDEAAPAVVDVNAATRVQLIAVPGIGEKTADAILNLRADKGRITDLSELLVIKGISERKLEAFKKYLIIS
jgi:competence ComEA-like helix-hairpin-helix protein